MLRENQPTTVSSGTPRRRASVHTAGSPNCRPEIPPQATWKSPAPANLRSAVEGEWSLTTRSIVPSSRPAHSTSWFAASRIGGQHLYWVAPSGMCASSNTR